MCAMRIRSHIDLCFFVVFAHIPREQIGNELLQVIMTTPMHDGSLLDIGNRLPLRSHQVMFHENYHYWQGLRLPFLFRYAFLAFRKILIVFKRLSNENSDFHTWDCLLPELHRLDLKPRVGYAPGGTIYWGGTEANFPRDLVAEYSFSPIDLLESAASVAEFQVMTSRDEAANALAFSRWAKHNAAYLAPFKFAAELLGNEQLTLRLFLPLVNAAFHTTEPTRAFVELLARVWGNFVVKSDFAKRFLDQPEPCRWKDVFDHFLDDIKYEAPPDSCGEILGTKFYRLNLDNWVFSRIVSPQSKSDYIIHPFLGPAARRWCELEKTNPAYSWLLGQPAWVDTRMMEGCMNDFAPPLSIIRFHLGGGQDRVFCIGRGDFSGFTTVHDGSDPRSKGLIADCMTMYGAVRRASGAHFDGEQRTCHHLNCPEYAHNYCNAYPIIPRSYTACGFPDRINRLIKLRRKADGDVEI